MRIFTIFFTLVFFCAGVFGSVTVSVNGTNYTIPQTNEKGWGTNVTTWIQNISQFTLQPSGGTFTLTAEVDTGATYGFKVPYIKTQTTTPATAGVLRLAKTDVIDWRNNANGANLPLGIDSSDNLTFNSVIVPTATSATVQDSTFRIYDDGDNTKKIAFQASGITTGTTRSLTVPDADITLVGTAATQTLTNKTWAIGSNTFTGQLTVPNGGTGAATLTNHGVLLGQGTSAVAITAAGSSGQLLASAGASSDPGWTTPTYPTSSGTAGKFLRSDGTNNVYTTMTHPDTAATGSILNASGTNVLAATVTPTIGLAGTSTGTIGLSGVTSGVVTVQPQSAAGTYNFNLPITAGSSGTVLTSAGGGSSPMTWSSVLTNPMTTAGDIIMYDSSAIRRVTVGSLDITNCSLAGTVASNALTIALKDAAGNDPSATSPCAIPFRNATAATGTYAVVLATAATSVVVSNGSALGCTASVACQLHIYAINNAGTIEIGVIGQGMLDEGTVQSSAAEGGAGGADTVGVLYSTTTRSSKAIRLLGRMTITPGASFAWSAGPTEISNVPFRDSRFTDWVSYTPTGAWSSNVTYTGKWRRVGDSMEVLANVAVTGVPTNAVFTITIPTGFTIDTNKIPVTGSAGAYPTFGNVLFVHATSGYPGYVVYNNTTSVYAGPFLSNGTYVQVDNTSTTVPFVWANGDTVTIRFTVPIVGW